MEKVVGYCRASGEFQCQEDKFGIECQKAEIERYCEAHGFEVVEWYIDEAKSGAKMDRPDLDRILYGELPEGVKAVVVAKSDRVARDIEIYYYYKMVLRMKDIELYSASEDFGVTGPMRDLLESFTMCAAKMERENIMHRTMAGRQMKKRQGGYIGGKPPYGYKPDSRSKKLVIDENRAKIVRYIIQESEKGRSMRSIQRAVVASGMAESIPFETVRRIINNRKFYEGYVLYDGEWIQGQHEGII